MSKKNLLCLAIGCFVIFAFASCMTIHPRAKVYFLCFQIVMALIVFVSSLMLGFAVLNDWHKNSRGQTPAEKAIMCQKGD